MTELIPQGYPILIEHHKDHHTKEDQLIAELREFKTFVQEIAEMQTAKGFQASVIVQKARKFLLHIWDVYDKNNPI